MLTTALDYLCKWHKERQEKKHPPNTKRCGKCKKLKYLSEFNKNRYNPDGLQYYCKLCKRAVSLKAHRKEGKYQDREYKIPVTINGKTKMNRYEKTK